MKTITEKQIDAIHKMAKATKTEVKDIEQMSCFEASQMLESLIGKWKQIKERRASPASNGKARNYSSDALAGLAVKIVAQKCKVDDVLQKEESFKKTVAQLYRVFFLARQGCLA